MKADHTPERWRCYHDTHTHKGWVVESLTKDGFPGTVLYVGPEVCARYIADALNERDKLRSICRNYPTSGSPYGYVQPVS